MSGPALRLRRPAVDDGPALWRLAGACGLDVNSAYYYLAFCRDFAETSVVAVTDRGVAGFVTGYRRPDAFDTLFVWQVAVDVWARRRGLGLAMLEHLRERLAPGGLRFVEASVTPSNGASLRLFRALATCSAVGFAEGVLFADDQFPAEVGHEEELLVRIGPFTTGRDDPGDDRGQADDRRDRRTVDPRARDHETNRQELS